MVGPTAIFFPSKSEKNLDRNVKLSLCLLLCLLLLLTEGNVLLLGPDWLQLWWQLQLQLHTFGPFHQHMQLIEWRKILTRGRVQFKKKNVKTQ